MSLTTKSSRSPIPQYYKSAVTVSIRKTQFTARLAPRKISPQQFPPANLNTRSNVSIPPRPRSGSRGIENSRSSGCVVAPKRHVNLFIVRESRQGGGARNPGSRGGKKVVEGRKKRGKKPAGPNTFHPRARVWHTLDRGQVRPLVPSNSRLFGTFHV